MAEKNTNLHNAKKAKNDEFYTQLSDIEKEMKHYKDFFKGKVVFCNCDDARESNFFQYFAINFEYLGLKKLICIGYKENGRGILLEYEGDKNGNRVVDDEEVIATELEGDGDFRSEESIKYLKECDVVVTNPPFSLFREYVAQLIEYGKKFLIIGNGNAVTYKEIFPLIKNNEMWVGNKSFSGGMDFVAGENYDSAKCKHPKYDESGNIIINVMMCIWFTNINHTKRNIPIDLYRRYNETEYPKYDNYDAIEVSKVSEIPMDYEGVIGVPITFLDKYCPTQFEIVDINPHFYTIVEQGLPKPKQLSLASYGKKDPYARILIRKKAENTNTSTDNGTEVANIITDNTPNEVVEENIDNTPTEVMEEKPPFFKRIKVVLNKLGILLLTLPIIF